MICGRTPNKCRTNPKSISRITVRWHFSHVKQYNSQASNVSLSTWGFAIKSWWYWAIPGASKVFMKKLRNLYNFNVCVFAPGLQRLHYWTPFWMAFWKGLFLHQKMSGSKWSEHVLCWCPVVNVVFGGEGLVGGWRVDFTSTTCLWSHLVYGLFCTLKTFWKKNFSCLNIWFKLRCILFLFIGFGWSDVFSCGEYIVEAAVTIAYFF